MRIPVLSLVLSFPLLAAAQWSVYRPQNPLIIYNGESTAATTSTVTAASAYYTGAAAYDTTILKPPPVPSDPSVPTNFGLQLWSGGMTNLSVPQQGSFFGFSIEMSVANLVCKSHALLPRRVFRY